MDCRTMDQPSPFYPDCGPSARCVQTEFKAIASKNYGADTFYAQFVLYFISLCKCITSCFRRRTCAFYKGFPFYFWEIFFQKHKSEIVTLKILSFFVKYDHVEIKWQILLFVSEYKQSGIIYLKNICLQCTSRNNVKN